MNSQDPQKEACSTQNVKADFDRQVSGQSASQLAVHGSVYLQTVCPHSALVFFLFFGNISDLCGTHFSFFIVHW